MLFKSFHVSLNVSQALISISQDKALALVASQETQANKGVFGAKHSPSSFPWTALRDENVILRLTVTFVEKLKYFVILA